MSLPKALEDGSSSSSGSSSGYGSQNAVKIEENKNPGKAKNPANFVSFACSFLFVVLFFVSLCDPFCLGYTTRIENYCTYKHSPNSSVFSKLRPSHFTSPLIRHQHTPPIVENIISDHYCHRNRSLRRSDSYSPGRIQFSHRVTYCP